MGEMAQLVTKMGVDLSAVDGQLKTGLAKQEAYAKTQEGIHKESLSRVEKMYQRIKLQNAVSVANVSGNREQLQDLQDQLELTRQIGLARKAGLNQGNAEAAAQAQMTAIRAARAEAEASAVAIGHAQREAALEQIALQEKLAVARARGEKREVEALEEELALVQAITRYRAAGFGEQEAAAMAGAHMGNLGAARKQAKRGNVGEAVEETFERARFGVLEEGGARIGIFGGALEKLGIAGIAAGAGLLVAGEGMEHVKEAAEYAEELSNAASRLGVTTKALQEYQYVALLSGTSTDAMREALQKGNEVLGAFQSGVGAAKIKPVFQALGISQEEAQKASSITALLPGIAEKIKDVGSVAEQTKLAEKLGLSAILPVLQKGREGIQELRQEAVESGTVLDTELVQRGKDAAEEYKKAAAAVDGNMKRAFIELAPLIEKCLGLAAELAKQFADAMDSFHGIESQNRTHVADEKINTNRGQGVWAALSGGKVDKDGNLQGGAWLQTQMFNRGKARLARLDARDKALDAQDAKADAATHTPPAKTLVADKPKREKKGPEDRTDGLDKAAADARDSAAKELASAQAALAKGFLEHAEFEKKAVDSETEKKLQDLANQEANVRKAKVDAHSKQQLAALEAAKADTLSAATAKKELIDRQALEAQQAFQREMSDQIANAMADHLTNEASIASSSAERRKLELQALAIRQQAAREDFEAKAKVTLRDHPEAAGRISQQRDQLDQSQSDAWQDTVRATNSPGRAFDRDLDSQKGALGDQLETIEVGGVEKLGDELDAVITKTKTVKDAFRDMVMSIVGDLLKLEIKRNIETPLADAIFAKPKASVQVGSITSGIPGASGGGDMTGLNGAATAATNSLWSLASAAGAAAGQGGAAATGAGAGGLPGLGGSSGALDTALTNTGMDPSGNADLNVVGKGISAMGGFAKMFGIPGFKDGTDDAPGGVTEVGENGPELLKVPGGSQVMTNTELRALPSGGPPAGGQSVTMNHNISIDLSGANGDEAIASAARAAAQQGAQLAIMTSRKDLKKASSAGSRNLTRY